MGGLQKNEALPDDPEPFGLVLIGRRPRALPAPPPAGRVVALVEILASAYVLPLL